MNLRLLPLIILMLTPACTIEARGGARWAAPPPPPPVAVTVHVPVATVRLQGRTFVHRVDGHFNSFVRFRTTGHGGTSGMMMSQRGQGSWSLDGSTLVMRWPDAGAPGGVWIDTVALSADGRSYQGTNNVGSAISGSRGASSAWASGGLW